MNDLLLILFLLELLLTGRQAVIGCVTGVGEPPKYYYGGL